jgi:ribosomal protein S15P/S13E
MYDEDDRYPDDPDYTDRPDYDERPDYPERPQPSRWPYPPSPRFYAESLGGVLQALTEYARTLEHEKSNRADIERKRTSALLVIRSQRRMMIEYLSSRFGERSALFEQYFKLIDTALELQNEEIVRLALESILNIYQDNPGGSLEEFRRQFEAINEVVRI